MRLFLHISFDGTTFNGWQRQKNTANTIQEVLEQILRKLFKKHITVYGCGRTDAGVHASQYAVHINLDEAPSFDLKYRLNKNLPESIAVLDVIEVSEDQHCRYDATSRTYDYFLHWKKDPMLIRYSAFYEDLDLDFEQMRAAATLILETRDCKALCKKPELYDNTQCTITKSSLVVDKYQGRLQYTVTSNRFLRGMVRLSVFYLLKVGNGELALDAFKSILNQEITLKQTQPALPNGLFLSEVEYPYIKISNASNFVERLRVQAK